MNFEHIVDDIARRLLQRRSAESAFSEGGGGRKREPVDLPGKIVKTASSVQC